MAYGVQEKEVGRWNFQVSLIYIQDERIIKMII